MSPHPYNVLFLCTGNSARSILAEAVLNHRAQGRFVGYSAGSLPKGRVHPLALELLQELGLPASGYRSKSWDEFATVAAPVMHFVFTVCDNAADEVCPVWPGKPVTAHWGIADPAAASGSDAQKRAAFRAAYHELDVRIRAFLALPLDQLDSGELKRRAQAIGRTPESAPT